MNKKKIITVSLYFCILLILASVPVFATEQVVGNVKKLTDLIIAIIAAAGVAVLAWGIFGLATAMMSHDNTQISVSIARIAGGLVMMAVSPIVSLLS